MGGENTVLELQKIAFSFISFIEFQKIYYNI